MTTKQPSTALIAIGVAVSFVAALAAALFIGWRWATFFEVGAAPVYVASRAGGSYKPAYVPLIWQTPLAMLFIWAMLNTFPTMLERLPKRYASISFAVALLATSASITAAAVLTGVAAWVMVTVTAVTVLTLALLLVLVRRSRMSHAAAGPDASVAHRDQ